MNEKYNLMKQLLKCCAYKIKQNVMLGMLSPMSNKDITKQDSGCLINVLVIS